MLKVNKSYILQFLVALDLYVFEYWVPSFQDLGSFTLLIRYCVFNSIHEPEFRLKLQNIGLITGTSWSIRQLLTYYWYIINYVGFWRDKVTTCPSPIEVCVYGKCTYGNDILLCSLFGHSCLYSNFGCLWDFRAARRNDYWVLFCGLFFTAKKHLIIFATIINVTLKIMSWNFTCCWNNQIRCVCNIWTTKTHIHK